MTDVQKYTTVAFRFVALWLFLQGLVATLALSGVIGGAMGGMMREMMPRAALLGSLVPTLGGIALFFGAPALARLMTFDFD